MSEGLVRSIRGMSDLLPPESGVFAFIESEMRRVFALYGFREIRTPILEETTLFARAVGEETDIVGKEMYTFTDRDGTSLTLRPEGTASAVRAYIEHGMDRNDPVARWFYTGPMFRHERPQKGRFRQFHQIGAEVFGLQDPHIDAELIHMLASFIRELGVEGVSLRLNSLGCDKCRPAFREALNIFLKRVEDSLCDDCRKRMTLNPLRVLDCKKEKCISVTMDAPSATDHLCDECSSHFKGVTHVLSAFGVDWEADKRMVRGLDYYSRTTFELLATAPGAEVGSQNAIAGGGRYDNLVEMLGGRPTPAVGFAIGMERLAMLLGGKAGLNDRPVKIFVMSAGSGTLSLAANLVSGLRKLNIATEFDGSERGFKAKFKRADKSGAGFAVVIGENEMEKSVCVVKSMSEIPLADGKKQIEVLLNGAAEVISKMLSERGNQ